MELKGMKLYQKKKKTYKGTHAMWLNWHCVQNQVELSSDTEAKLVLDLARGGSDEEIP